MEFEQETMCSESSICYQERIHLITNIKVKPQGMPAPPCTSQKIAEWHAKIAPASSEAWQ
eukprot:1154189-Pelagomonas_calceolata.AAC.4